MSPKTLKNSKHTYLTNNEVEKARDRMFEEILKISMKRKEAAGARDIVY